MICQKKPHKKLEIWKYSGNEKYPLKIVATKGILKFNKTASLIWLLIDGKHTVKDIVAELQVQFPDQNQKEVEKDVIDFCQKLDNIDLIVLNWTPLQP